MLRFGLLSTVVPLVLAGGVAHDWDLASARHCPASAIAPSVRAVAFTADPAAATVKVQIVEAAELADLVIADDSDATGIRGCSLTDAARLVRIETQPRPGDPLVHLTREDDADYRIYLQSAQVSAEQVAALIVTARGGQLRLAAHPFDDPPTGSVSR